MHASPSAFSRRRDDHSIPFLWWPLLATAMEFESGAVLQALISLEDHLRGNASWRVTRHAGDGQSIVASGEECSLDGAAAAVGDFVSSWTIDGRRRSPAPVRDPRL